MATEVFMPKMSDHMEYGEIIRWLVNEGDEVKQGQVIMEVESDKVVVEFEAPASGVLKGIRKGAAEGAIIPVGETFAFIAEPNEDVPALPPFQELGETESIREGDSPGKSIDPKRGTSQSVRASPLARRTAKELGIDISQVKGTGSEGRITVEDVRASVMKMKSKPGEGRTTGEFTWMNLTATQRKTGERMLESIHTAPQFTLSVNADMTVFLASRETLSDHNNKEMAESLSVTIILIKAVAVALRSYPTANASFDDGRLKLYSDINIGVAIASDEGLVVPVIRNADRKTIVEIARELKEYRNKTALKRFNSEDLAGGTFTISNLGMHGIDTFQAIINPPECGILAVGRIIPSPVCLTDDSVAIRPIMNLTLTVDHRCMDGLQAANFLVDVKGRIENEDFFREELLNSS